LVINGKPRLQGGEGSIPHGFGTQVGEAILGNVLTYKTSQYSRPDRER